MAAEKCAPVNFESRLDDCPTDPCTGLVTATSSEKLVADSPDVHYMTKVTRTSATSPKIAYKTYYPETRKTRLHLDDVGMVTCVYELLWVGPVGSWVKVDGVTRTKMNWRWLTWN